MSVSSDAVIFCADINALNFNIVKDFWIVRENTEGEYSEIGGRIFAGTERETVVQQTIMTRTGVDRILKYAFDLAQSRPAKNLTSASEFT